MNWYKLTKSAAQDYLWVQPSRYPNPVEIVLNPNTSDLQRLAKDGQIRMMLMGTDKLYIWSPYELLHGEVAGSLKLGNNRIPLMGITTRGSIYNVYVTDNSDETDWHRNPKVRDAILSNKPLMNLVDEKFKDSMENVGYYDQDIVGPWHDFEANKNVPEDLASTFHESD
jgi:hypothetical protein